MILKTLKYTLLLVTGFLLSCKPQISLSGMTIPPEAKTVSIGFFTNNTTLGAPSLSQRFTERLKDMVSQQTQLALMSKNGDLQFEGYIGDYAVSPVAIQSNDIANKNRLTITVHVVYFNKFDPTKNFEQDFPRFADYNASQSISSVEADLVQEIYRQICEDIFNRAFNNW